MSYRHPRFYKEDYGSFGKAFQKNFDTQFNNVMDYYEQQGAARKEYENDLYAQADKMREDAKAAGATAADLKGKIEDQVQAFLKEGLEVGLKQGAKGSGFLGMNIRETGKKNRLQLDEANASFNANIQAANQITDRAFVSGLQVDEDYDHGSGSYLEYASVVKSLQNQQGTADFTYSGDNKFSFGVEIDNPRYDPELPVNDNQYLEDGKTRNPDYNPKKLKYNAEEVQRLIGENDPEARKQIEENINTATETLLKTAESDLERKFAQGNAYGDPTKGAAYLGETAVKEVVGGYMQELQQQDENNPDEGSIIDDIYNNKVKFNDKTRMEIFQGIEGSEFLLDKISKDGNINPELADEMAMLLDLPKNDITYQRRILKKLGVTEPEDVKRAMDSINAAKDGMVERYLVNEVYGSGITSKYIKPQAPKPSGPTGGSRDDTDGYPEKKFNEAARALGGTMVQGIDDPDFVGPQTAMLQDSNYNYFDTAANEKAEIESVFKNMQVNTKDGKRIADDVVFDPRTKKLNLTYLAKTNVKSEDADGKEIYGDLPATSFDYDMSDPDQFEKLYLRMGIKATGQKGAKYEVDFGKMASNYGKVNFFNHLQDQGVTDEISGEEDDVPVGYLPEKKLGSGNMSKWVTKTIREDKQFVVNSIDQVIKNNPADWDKLSKNLIVTPRGQQVTIGQWYDAIVEIRNMKNK